MTHPPHPVSVASPEILRLKPGYNPNSSSVGSLLPRFLGLALGAGALTVAGLQLLADRVGLQRQTASEATQPESTSGSASSAQDREPRHQP